MSHYEHYFSRRAQIGSGVSDIGSVHRSPKLYYQRGRGFGQALGGIWRFLSPYIISSSKAIGREALRSGAEILRNVGSQPLKDLVRDQVKTSRKNLTFKAGEKLRAMSGEGIKRRKRRTQHPINSLLTRRITSKRKKPSPGRTVTKRRRRKKSSPASSKIPLNFLQSLEGGARKRRRKRKKPARSRDSSVSIHTGKRRKRRVASKKKASSTTSKASAATTKAQFVNKYFRV